jgi:arylsulfatase A-like enzyme
LIVFTADHGEAFFRENLPFKFSHSGQLAPEVLAVPFILSSSNPNVRRGSRYSGVSRSIDVFPTMVGLSRVALPADHGIRGVDLSSALMGKKQPPQLEAYSHTSVLQESVQKQMHDEEHAAKWTQLRRFYPRRDVNLIWVSMKEEGLLYKFRNLDGERWGFQLFNLAADPIESTNLFDPTNPTHQEASTRLRNYKQRLVESWDRSHDSDEGVVLDEREEEILRRLGYIE